LLHLLGAVGQRAVGAFEVPVLVLVKAKKNLQDFDPEMTTVEHGCELQQR
jgi:hypothetical protein